MPDGHALLQAARAILPPGVTVAWADPRQMHPLLPGEAVPRATPQRLAEFSAGRHAARAALDGLALPATAPTATALPAGPDRAPVWPAGITGSITHTRSACLAIAGRAEAFLGLGLDLEEDAPLEQDLWDDVLVPEEQIWLARQPAPDRGRLAKLMFSAKEAAYKAQYAQSRTLFGFDAMVLTLGEGAFTARFRHPVAPFAAGAAIHGRYRHVSVHVLTVASLPL